MCMCMCMYLLTKASAPATPPPCVPGASCVARLDRAASPCAARRACRARCPRRPPPRPRQRWCLRHRPPPLRQVQLEPARRWRRRRRALAQALGRGLSCAAARPPRCRGADRRWQQARPPIRTCIHGYWRIEARTRAHMHACAESRPAPHTRANTYVSPPAQLREHRVGRLGGLARPNVQAQRGRCRQRPLAVVTRHPPLPPPRLAPAARVARAARAARAACAALAAGQQCER